MFVGIIDWLYICYVIIMLRDQMENQDMIKISYHVEEKIGVCFNQIEPRQKIAITGN